VVVYEAEAMEREDGEKSFAERWLWSRQVGERNTRSQVNGNGDGVETNGDGRLSEGKEESQFTIADEEDDDEGDVGVDGEARAFKATVGHPAATVNGDGASHRAQQAPIVDPLSQPTSNTEEVENEEKEEREETIPCLVDRLFSCTIDLLFCAGFTVPDNVRGQDGLGEKINVGHHSVV